MPHVDLYLEVTHASRTFRKRTYLGGVKDHPKFINQTKHKHEIRKQQASTKYYKTSYKKFEDITFDEKVRRKEMLDRPVDPEVARAYNFLSRQKKKREKAKNKAVAAIMQMRGI